MELWGSGNNHDCDTVAIVLEEKGIFTIHPTGNSCCSLTVTMLAVPVTGTFKI